jgi:broad specificity phosphatase PhoE
MSLKRLFLIRHGQSEANIDFKKAFDDNPDYAIPLTALGQKQALEAGHFLKKYIQKTEWVQTALWQSSFKRARQTAEGVLKNINPHHHFEDNYLVEQQFGLFSYSSREEHIKNFPAEHAFIKQNVEVAEGKFWARFPLGESMSDVDVRIGLFLNNLKEDAQNLGYETAIIVSHGTTLRVLESRLLRKPFETLNDRKLNPENCSINLLEFDQKFWVRKGYIHLPSIK